MFMTRFAIGVFMSLSLSRRQILATTASAAGVAVLAACGSANTSNNGAGGGDGGGNGDSASGSSVGYPVTIKHAQGELTLDKAPERVVVLDLGVLDSIASLDLSSAVAGVPKTSTTYPDSLSEFQSDTYKDVGTVKEPDEEAIADIDPDLVIVAKRTSKAYETLSANFPTIDMTVKADDATDGAAQGGGGGGGEGQQKSATATATLTSYADILGNIFNKKDDAQAKLSEFTTAADEVAKVAKDAGKGLFLMTNGDKVTAFGTGSRFDVVFDEFGVTPAVEDVEAATHGEAIDFEFIGDADPDLLFVLDRSAAIGQEGTPAKEVLNNDIVNATKAWKNNKVFYVNGVDWYIIGEGFTASPRMAEEIKNDLSS